jgi:tRNA modification GTPase
MTVAAGQPLTFAMRLTSLAPAAIAVIEVEGPDAAAMVLACWKPARSVPLKLNAIRYGAWIGANDWVGANDWIGANDQLNSSTTTEHYPWDAPGIMPAAEDIVVCLTDVDRIEIHCHGGKLAVERILRDLQRRGAIVKPSLGIHRQARMQDRWSQHAWEDLANATTPLATGHLLDQAHGALTRALAEIEEDCLQGLAHTRMPSKLSLESQIDELLARYEYGKHLTQPWKLAIVGPPNSGKSSLLNAILGFDRAIVDPTAGTTRDVLRETTSLLGWPFEVVDTAGIRETNDMIESEGIARALSAMSEADLVLCLIDPCVGWTDLHREFARSKDSLFVVTKADLRLPPPILPNRIQPLLISAQQRLGFDELYQACLRSLIPNPPQRGQAIPFRQEQRQYLETLRSRYKKLGVQ